MGAMKMGDERRATTSIYGPALANKIECEMRGSRRLWRVPRELQVKGPKRIGFRKPLQRKRWDPNRIQTFSEPIS